MDALGGYFREEREVQGLTFEQLAALTKIKESYLQALEEECFNLLPEKVFTKGFVRIYAQALGLDEEEALRRFSFSALSYYKKEEIEQQQVIQREEDDRKGEADRNAVRIITGVILIGLVFVFILSREQSSPPTLKTSSTPKSILSTSPAPTAGSEIVTTPSETKTEGRSDHDVESAGQEASEPPSTLDTGQSSVQVDAVSEFEASPPRPVQPAEPVGKRRTFEPASGEQDGPIMLELEALEITWVVVRSDDRAPHEALLQPGERALWRAHERFLLTLGNASGVRVTLNGEPRGPFGGPGAVIRELEIKP